MIKELPADHAGQKARYCRVCGEFKPPEDFAFHKHKSHYGGFQALHFCKPCEKRKKLEAHLKRTYGLSWQDYTDMVISQDNKCYLCGEGPSDKYDRLVVDHCHKTNAVRKLLCRMCNTYLAKIEACPNYFKKVSSYLNYIGDIT